MIARRRLDVSTLAPGAFGHRGLMWWGTTGFMLIEGTMFGLVLTAYFYIRTRTSQWPPDHIAPPDLLWGTTATFVLLASMVPNELAKKAAERVDLAAVRLWLIVTIAFGMALVALRATEFFFLNVTWSDNAYGSIVWMLLGLHTTHLLTDFVDTGVLAALMFKGPIEEKRFVDVAENAIYWNFVILTWLVIYGVIYWAPRLL